jgi:hypothetical protein
VAKHPATNQTAAKHPPTNQPAAKHPPGDKQQRQSICYDIHDNKPGKVNVSGKEAQQAQ